MTVTTALDGAVLTVTIDRAEALNALDGATLEALNAAWHRAAASDVGAVVLTGAGRAFCAGADLREPALAPEQMADNQRARYNTNVLAMVALQKPIVAAVNGPAAGAGLSLACAADVRIASDTAFFVPGFAGVGVVPDAGASWFVPRLVGTGRALDWFCSTRRLGATEALAWGLVNEVVPAAELVDRAQARAAELAAIPGRAVALTKQLLNVSGNATLAEQLEREVRCQAAAVVAPGRDEARRAAVGGAR